MTRKRKQPPPPARQETWNEELSRTLAEQRGRVREFLALQRERLGRVETALAAEIRQQREELARPEEVHNATAEQQADVDPAPRSAAEPGLDWEAEKRRILAALETEDQGAETEAETAARWKIRAIVRTTDQALAEKDREIAEIKHVLQEQSNNLEGVAVGAAALEAVLDHDPLIREQRANLQNLQQQWQDMLRQAEVDLSVERAKLARERIAIDDKVRAYDEKLAAGANNSPAARPPRGRWLARLGLKDGIAE
jgi:hypothetical protein